MSPRVAINDKKRDEMSALILSLGRRGWSAAQIAAWTGVAVGTVHAWRRGESMGTNGQRADLARLKSPAEERERMSETVRAWEQEAVRADSLAAGSTEAAAHHVSKVQARRAAYLRERAALIRKLFSLTSDGDPR